MAEAVTNSLQCLTDADLSALVAYIQAILPIREAGATRPNYAWGGPIHPEATIRGVSDIPSGAVLYSRYCGSCHQASGAGTRDQANPSLFNNTATGSQRPDILIAAIVLERSARLGDARWRCRTLGQPHTCSR